MDHVIRIWIVTHRLAVLDRPMWLLSAVGRGGLIFVAIGVGLFLAKRCSARALLELVLAIAIATTMSDYVLKPIVARERPYIRNATYRTIGALPLTASFPSGHTANAVAGALVLTVIAPRARALWWALAAAIAYSRLYLGVHYPFDVLGGAIVGLLASALVGFVMRGRFAEPKL